MSAALWLMASCCPAQMLIVLSDESTSYQDVAQELRTNLAPVRDGRLKIDVVTAPQLTTVSERGLAAYELVVTVGLAAAQAVVAYDNGLSAVPPTLCLLIPRLSFERLARTNAPVRPRRYSAVFIDQPLSRQLDLIRIALPDKSRVGVILGPGSLTLREELRDSARERTLTLNPAEVGEASAVYGALQKVLPESDVLLALPDPVALNASTAYGVLLTSYRARIPVAGFSEGLVKAGALLAVYSSARQQGKQGAEIASRILTGEGGLPAPQYPRYFTVAVNFSVARSLGLRMDDEATLAIALSQRTQGAAQGEGANAPRRGP